MIPLQCLITVKMALTRDNVWEVVQAESTFFTAWTQVSGTMTTKRRNSSFHMEQEIGLDASSEAAGAPISVSQETQSQSVSNVVTSATPSSVMPKKLSEWDMDDVYETGEREDAKGEKDVASTKQSVHAHMATLEDD